MCQQVFKTLKYRRCLQNFVSLTDLDIVIQVHRGGRNCISCQSDVKTMSHVIN